MLYRKWSSLCQQKALNIEPTYSQGTMQPVTRLPRCLSRELPASGSRFSTTTSSSSTKLLLLGAHRGHPAPLQALRWGHRVSLSRPLTARTGVAVAASSSGSSCTSSCTSRTACTAAAAAAAALARGEAAAYYAGVQVTAVQRCCISHRGVRPQQLPKLNLYLSWTRVSRQPCGLAVVCLPALSSYYKLLKGVHAALAEAVLQQPARCALQHCNCVSTQNASIQHCAAADALGKHAAASAQHQCTLMQSHCAIITYRNM
eukprot:15448-Heterococcus_DN1.PRE.1